MSTMDLFDDIEYQNGINTPLLDFYRQQGCVFMSIKQVAAVLNDSYDEVKYAITNYQLDAFYVLGNYRITRQAVEDYIEGLQSQYEEAYHSVVLRLQLDGIYELANGSGITRALRSVARQGLPVTALDELMQKTQTWHYDELPAGETKAMDFYDIPSLELPEIMFLGDLAGLLDVPCDRLKKVFNLSDEWAEIAYSEVYDFLVDCEVVNASIPFGTPRSQSFISETEQPKLL